MVALTATPNLTTHMSYCLVLLDFRVLDLAGMSLGGLKVFKLLQQMSLLYPSGQSLFLVVFVVGGGSLVLLLSYFWLT